MKRRLILTAVYIALCIAVYYLALFISDLNEPCYVKMEYTVARGDTYDILADRLEITEDRRDWRERVKRLNGREDSMLYSGEVIYVLVEE